MNVNLINHPKDHLRDIDWANHYFKLINLNSSREKPKLLWWVSKKKSNHFHLGKLLDGYWMLKRLLLAFWAVHIHFLNYNNDYNQAFRPPNGESISEECNLEHLNLVGALRPEEARVKTVYHPNADADEKEKHKIYARMTCTKLHCERVVSSSPFWGWVDWRREIEVERISFFANREGANGGKISFHCRSVHSTIALPKAPEKKRKFLFKKLKELFNFTLGLGEWR